MWVIRSYRNIKNKEYMGFKVVDSRSCLCKFMKPAEVAVLARSNKINNMELSTNNKLVMKDLRPNKNYKDYFFSGESTKGIEIKSYCILLDKKCNNDTGETLVTFIADSLSDGAFVGNQYTLQALAKVLRVMEVSKIRMYNAIVKDDGQVLSIGDIEKKEEDTKRRNEEALRKIKEQLNGFECRVNDINDNKLDIKYLVKKGNGLGYWELPSFVYKLDRFGGGVNNLVLSDNLLSLSEGCFEELDDLNKLTFGRKIKKIPERCCADNSIEKVEFSGQEMIIGSEAFKDCDWLQGPIVTNAYVIEDSAFEGIKAEVISLMNIRKIGSDAFAACLNLRSVKLSDTITDIMGGAFRECGKLQDIKFPASLKRIGPYAFSGCTKLKEVKVSKDTDISSTAFPKKTIITRY